MMIPAVKDILIKVVSGYSLTEFEAGLVNCIAMNKDGKVVAAVRPVIKLMYDGALATLDGKGRGVHYWDETGKIYFVNDDIIGYVASTSYTSLGTTTASAIQRCYFEEIGDKLMVLDPENSEGYTITSLNVMTKITDADFPTSLAHGLAQLNGRSYVLTPGGVIWGSDADDATAWDSLNFITAERYSDSGIYIDAIQDHIVVLKSRSIEFFYDAGNATGSLLNRRDDIVHRQGCSDGMSAARNGDLLFFVGESGSGSFGAYVIENLGLKKISTPSIDKYLSKAVSDGSAVGGLTIMGASFTENGHLYYSITAAIKNAGEYLCTTTLVFDMTTGLWYTWSTAINQNTAFPLMNYRNQSFYYGTGHGVSGYGILPSGDIVSLSASESLAGELIVVDYYINKPSGNDADQSIGCVLRTGQIDLGTKKFKFIGDLEVAGERSPSQLLMTLKYAKDNNKTFSDGRTIDMATYRGLSRNGKARRINFELSWGSAVPVYIEGIELPDISVGSS